ncbi:Organic cation transporter protein [Chionoecetes opilio]|uniref:Organic cation transporter protein n=1 Tax=Chionoecetes opilio TaxID=41210 RepID=A0A8J4Y308_CHIOP|nr:Organic cation transporter protein [Chionoecetes opilio]
MVLISSTFYILSSFIIAVSPNVESYIFFKGIITMIDAGTFLGLFVFVMETCATKYRAAAGTLFEIPKALGYMAVPGLAYLVRTWRLLQVAYAFPSFLGILFFMWLPESPRWLIVKGRHQEALKVMTQVAKVNGKTLPPDHQVLAAMKVIGQKTVLQPVVEEEGKRTGRVLSRAVQAIRRLFILFILPEFRVRTLVVIYCCCSASLVYYGLALNSNNINTDPYMYVFLGGLLEVPSYVLLWPALIYIGRKKSLVALYFLCGIFIFLVMTLILLEPAGGDWAVVIFSQSGKVVITAAYQLVAIYTAELYPTKYRSLAMGMTALFGSVSFVAGALTLLLPETRHLDLSETTNFSTTKVTEEEGKKNVSTNNNIAVELDVTLINYARWTLQYWPHGGEWAVVILSQSSKVVITAAYQLVTMYTAELYPTKYRSLALGLNIGFAMTGAMASPYINDILGMKQVWGPSALFGSVSFVAGALTLLLPETRHLDLSEPTNFSTAKVTEEKGKKNVSTNNSVSTKETTKGVTNVSYVGED